MMCYCFFVFLNFVAMSAQCLVDLFAVLDRDGQRKEREETVESKIQATAK